MLRVKDQRISRALHLIAAAMNNFLFKCTARTKEDPCQIIERVAFTTRKNSAPRCSRVA